MLMYQKVFNAFYYFFKVDSMAVQLLNEKVKTAVVPDIMGMLIHLLVMSPTRFQGA